MAGGLERLRSDIAGLRSLHIGKWPLAARPTGPAHCELGRETVHGAGATGLTPGPVSRACGLHPGPALAHGPRVWADPPPCLGALGPHALVRSVRVIVPLRKGHGSRPRAGEAGTTPCFSKHLCDCYLLGAHEGLVNLTRAWGRWTVSPTHRRERRGDMQSGDVQWVRSRQPGTVGPLRLVRRLFPEHAPPPPGFRPLGARPPRAAQPTERSSGSRVFTVYPPARNEPLAASPDG